MVSVEQFDMQNGIRQRWNMVQFFCLVFVEDVFKINVVLMMVFMFSDEIQSVGDG